tara:strand:+ start:219 stop:644 length:426 start_codon:yes stop_codon:yes gene_type:complete
LVISTVGNNVVCVYFHKLLLGPPILQQETVLHGVRIEDSSNANHDHRVTSLGLSFRCASVHKTFRMESLVDIKGHYHDGAMFAQDTFDLLSIDKEIYHLQLYNVRSRQQDAFQHLRRVVSSIVPNVVVQMSGVEGVQDPLG